MKAGFSLIELMVVIAIVAILSAVAIPSYKLYIAKTKVANSLVLLRSYADKTILYYNQKGQIPTAAQLEPNANGQWLVSNGSFGGSPIVQTNLVSAYSVAYVYYSTFNTSGATPGFVFTARMVVGSTGITDLETKEFAFGAIHSNNTFAFSCGQWSLNASNSVSPEYLPGGCQATCVSVAISGTAC